MSQETMAWLRSSIRIGFTDERGPAWWASDEPLADGSHFPGAVPEAEVSKILNVPLVAAKLHATYEDSAGARQVVEAEGRQAIIRQDTGDVLGVFKEGYQVHSYQEWTADQITKLLHASSGELGVAAVGLLRNAAVAFLQAKITQDFEVQGFGYTPWITAATSCDGSLASTYITGVHAAVCDNTLSIALNAASTRLKIKHSRKSAGRIGEISNALGLVLQAGEAFAEQSENLMNLEVSDKDFAAWLDEIAPMPDKKDTKTGGPGRAYTMASTKRDALTKLWATDPMVKPWAGTAFGVVQLSNTYRTHIQTVKSADGGRIERNFTNDVTGISANADQEALDALVRVQARTLTLV